MQKQPEETEYQSDTSALLKLLRKTLAALDLILASEEYCSDSSAVIYKISEESKILLEIIKRQRNRTHFHFIANNEKMKTKAREWIMESRNKYANGYLYKDIRSFLQQIEIAFGIYEKNQEFVVLVTRVFTVISEQLRIFKIKYDLFHHKNPQNVDCCPPKVRKTKSLILNTNFLPTEYANLTALHGLDLDYAFLRNAVVSCRRNQIEFLQGQLERNRLISKMLDDYTREYYLMMNRAKVKRKHHSELYSRAVRRSVKNLRIKTTANEKVCHNFEQREGKRLSSKENREQPCSNKLVYKINNVYVSGNEFDVYSDQCNQFVNINRPKKKPPSFLTRAIRDPLANRINNCSTKELVS